MTSPVRALRVRAEYSVRSIATELGYKTGSGYQRFEDPSNTDGKELNPEFIRAFARAVLGKGKPPIEMQDLFPLLNKAPPFRTAAEKLAVYLMFGIEPPDGLRHSDDAGSFPVRSIPVWGEARASFWMSTPPNIDVPAEHLPIPTLDGYPTGEQYAVVVRGPSLNKVAQDGTYAICVRYESGLVDMRHGKFAHVQRERHGEIEWTLKRIRWEGPKPQLWPESTDPAYQEPITLNGDDEHVKVVGIVIGFYTKV